MRGPSAMVMKYESQPAQAPNQSNHEAASKNELAGKRLKTIATIAAGSVALGLGAGLFAPKLLNDKESSDLLSTKPAIEAPLVPGMEEKTSYTIDDINTMSSEQTRNLDEYTRLSLLGQEAEKYKPEVIEIMKKYINAEEAQLLKLDEPLPADKRDYTDEQLLRDSTVCIFQADSQGTRTDHGRKLLQLSIDPDTPKYNAIAAKIGDANGAILDVNTVVRSFPHISNSEFMGHTFGEDAGRIIEVQKVRRDGVVEESSLTLYKIAIAGEQQSIMQVDIWENDDPRVLAELRQLQAQQVN